MNEPGLPDPPLDPEDAFPDHVEDTFRPPWIDRLRPRLAWLAALVPIAAFIVAGVPFGGFRTLREAARAADPLTLLPGMHLDLEPSSASATRWAVTFAFAALIGALTWAWRAGTPGFGFFAGMAAFWLSLLVELARWLKPGQLPDFRDPLIAAAVAPVVWRLLRLLPVQPVTPLPRFSGCRMRRRILLRFFAAGVLLCVVGSGFAVAPLIDLLGYAPGQIASRIDALPHGGAIWRGLEATRLTPWLRSANRLDPPTGLAYPDWVGASAAHNGVLPEGRARPVSSVDALRQAIANAEPGDVILLQPGVYKIDGGYLTFGRAGSAAAPITLRAPQLGQVTLESALPEALKVLAPHWRFENLVLRGVCGNDNDCDNGFHIVGAAEDTVLRNLRIEDFNAQIKINGEGGAFPDNGRIERVTLIDTHARNTGLPVTPIDLVAADRWVIQDSLIADFVKLGGDRVSYGAFAKGAGHGTVFNRNVVLCGWRLRGAGQTIGLSFGGGSTEMSLRRDQGLSGDEYSDGVMTENLIAYCSDDGVYLNRAAGSALRHNTLIGTAGIDARYTETTALLEGNLVDGPIRARDDAMVWGEGNVSGSLTGMFLGRDPARALFMGPQRFDLRWRTLPELVKPDSGTDLCGTAWTDPAPAGAFQDFSKCGAAEK